MFGDAFLKLKAGKEMHLTLCRRQPSLPTRQLVLKVVPTEISFRLEGKGGSEEKSVRILGFKSVRSRPFLNLEGQFLHQNFQKLFLFKSY